MFCACCSCCATCSVSPWELNAYLPHDQVKSRYAKNQTLEKKIPECGTKVMERSTSRANTPLPSMKKARDNIDGMVVNTAGVKGLKRCAGALRSQCVKSGVFTFQTI